MALNQVGFGAPQGAGNPLQPLTDLVNSAIEKRKDRRAEQAGLNNRLEMMAVQHGLQTAHTVRKQSHERDMLGMKQSHALELQSRGMAHAEKQGKATRSHERSMTKLKQSHELAKTSATFSGIEQLGKGKRVGSFTMGQNGEMSVNYNKPTTRRRSSTTPGQPTQVAPTTPQRSTATPEVPSGTTKVAPVIRDPKTGRATRNPAYSSTSTPAAKATPKAARRPRSK